MAKDLPPSRTAPQFVVRLPDEAFRERLAEAAKANGRSTNSEIVSRLEASFQIAAESTSQSPSAAHIGTVQGRQDWLAMRGDVLKSRIEGLMLREYMLKDSAMRLSEKPQTDDDQARLRHIHSQLLSLDKDRKAITAEYDQLATEQEALKAESAASQPARARKKDTAVALPKRVTSSTNGLK